MFISTFRFFYTLTKALGQRFDIFSFPHPDLLSPEIIVVFQSSCFSNSLRISFTIYYLLSLMGERNSRVVPPFPESPRCLSPFQGNCFPCIASTFKPRIVSHHGGTWDSPVGKPRGKDSGKASRESRRSLVRLEGKLDTAATAREESARACPHSRRGLTPLGRLQK